MSIQNFTMLMKSIPTYEAEESDKDGESEAKKGKEEEVSFENFGSWVSDQRVKNKKR